jgi:cytochrome P450
LKPTSAGKPSASHTPVDINQEMMRLAMGIIGRTMFNMSIDQEAMQAASAFAYVLEFVSQQTIRFVDIPMFVPTRANRRFTASMHILDEFIYKIIAKRRQDPKPNEQNDLLALLMRARNPETGEPMSDKQLRDEVITIFFAGHETTAQALTWTWFLLAQHPEEEAKLHVELDQNLNGRIPDIDESKCCRTLDGDR